MADNRMYLTCKGCKEKIMLGKCLQMIYFNRDETKDTLGQKLDGFFGDHAFCSDDPEHGFELEYEA